jgi:hypothetical protein
MQLSELARFRLVYLATPYTKYEGGIDKAHEDACVLAGALLNKGIRVFSPIAHCHMIAKLGGVEPLSHEIWLEIDEPLMEPCEAILVGELDGWDESYGVDYELDVFNAAGKPVFFINPNTLEVRR